MTNKTSLSEQAYTLPFFQAEFFKGLQPANFFLPLDLGAALETQRKNIEALSEAQNIMLQNMQDIAKHQSHFLTRFVKDNAALANQVLTEGTPEEKISRQTDLLRQSYEESLSGLTDLSDFMIKSSRDSGKILSKRIAASMNEFKTGLEKSSAPLKRNLKSAA